MNKIVMNVLVVDDERIIREGVARVVQRCLPEAQIFSFGNAEDAFRKVQECSCDIAFLDIEMPGKSGIFLAREIREAAPHTNIIFTTAYPQYTNRAMELHASGYIVKPVTEEKVRFELEDLRYPPAEAAYDENRLYLRMFGNFEAFGHGKPIWFKYAKTKELLAYLADRRGALIDAKEIQAALWENTGSHISYYKQLRKDLIDTLRAEGFENAVIGTRGNLAISVENIQCDYYDYLNGLQQGLNAYHGEYLKQYSWAEATHGSLEMQETP